MSKTSRLDALAESKRNVEAQIRYHRSFVQDYAPRQNAIRNEIASLKKQSEDLRESRMEAPARIIALQHRFSALDHEEKKLRVTGSENYGHLKTKGDGEKLLDLRRRMADLEDKMRAAGVNPAIYS